MPSDDKLLEPGRNAVVSVQWGIAHIAARCFVCQFHCDYKKPLDDYEHDKLEICEKCAPYVDVQFSSELWP